MIGFHMMCLATRCRAKLDLRINQGEQSLSIDQTQLTLKYAVLLSYRLAYGGGWWLFALFDSSKLILCRANDGTGETREKQAADFACTARRERWTSTRAYTSLYDQPTQLKQALDMKKYDTLCSLALLGLAIIFDQLLPGVTRNHKFLFTGLLTLANCLLIIAPQLIICKKDLDREKFFVNALEKAAIADGSGKLATAIRTFLSALYDSHPRKKFSYIYALFFAFGDTERLDILERVYASLLSAQEFKDSVLKVVNSIRKNNRNATLEAVKSLDRITQVAARYHFHHDCSEQKKHAKRIKRTGLEVDTDAKRVIEDCKKKCYAQHVDILERAGRKVHSYWELPIQLRRVLLNSM